MSRLVAPLVLASASPRRRSILQRLNVPFRVEPSGVDETGLTSDGPRAHALTAAGTKATHVMGRLASEPAQPFVLGADTVVAVSQRVLGKPADDDEARRMLHALSGRWHEVTTAVVLGRVREGVLGTLQVTTGVRFRELAPEEIDGYVATGEGRDKAGAYGIQGRGATLVADRAGSLPNVVGLPAAETLQLLARHGVLQGWP